MELTESYEAGLPIELRDRYRLVEVRNATVILGAVAPSALADLREILQEFQLTASHLLDPGGSKSALAREIDEAFRLRGWRETHLQLNVDATLTRQPWSAEQSERRRLHPDRSSLRFVGQTHKVDNFRDRVAVEVEWNAKDGNLDRDLSAFRALYDAGVVDACVVITRHHASIRHASNFLAHELDRVNYRAGKEIERFKTTTTTNIERLRWRLERGDAGGCPVLGIGISAETYTPGHPWVPGPGEAAVEQPAIPPLDEMTERELEAAAVSSTEPDDEV